MRHSLGLQAMDKRGWGSMNHAEGSRSLALQWPRVQVPSAEHWWIPVVAGDRSVPAWTTCPGTHRRDLWGVQTPQGSQRGAGHWGAWYPPRCLW